jgi:glycosyltransferase involved in cell wall biosynthesis
MSDLFVLSSLYEGLPNVLLEALVLKKFIISSNCPTGPREILKNGKYGLLFQPGNYKDLVKKIYYFQKNKKKLNKKILNGFKSLSRFDYKSNSKKYLNIVQQHI